MDYMAVKVGLISDGVNGLNWLIVESSGGVLCCDVTCTARVLHAFL